MKCALSASALVLVVVVGLGGMSLFGLPFRSADAATVAPSWGTAIDIPGLTAPGESQNWLTQIACTSPGNCVAGGSYTTGPSVHTLLVEQVDGVWGDFFEVPGSWGFDPDDIDRRIETLACAPNGECVAAGNYATGQGGRVFVTRRVNGVWTDAEPLPGAAGLGNVGQFFVSASSCSSGGNCSIVGYYLTESYRWGGYTIDLVGGVWHDAADVPGLIALSTGDLSVLYSVSCPADGECSAAGEYHTSTESHGFVVDQSHGVWGQATDVPGLTTLAPGGAARSQTISCSSAGNCSVVGSYSLSIGPGSTVYPFVADRVAGTWTGAQTPVLAGADDSGLGVVSCPSDGNCSAIGRFHIPGDPVDGHDSLFVLERIGGSWTTPVPLPGLDAVNTGNNAWIESLTCAAPGSCAATGNFSDATGRVPFVVNSTGGVWTAPIAVAGVHGPSYGDCYLSLLGDTCPTGRSVSCPSPTWCAVAGQTFPGAMSRGFLVEYFGPPEPTPDPTTDPTTPVTPVFTG